MPAFLLDRVAFSFAQSFPTTPLSAARLLSHDADLAQRYDGRGQLEPFLLASGIEPSDLSRSTVVLAAELYLRGGHPMAEAMRRACALQLALQGGGLTGAWQGRRGVRRGARRAGSRAAGSSRPPAFVATPCRRLDALLAPGR